MKIPDVTFRDLFTVRNRTHRWERTSPSQIKDALRCLRVWWFRKILKMEPDVDAKQQWTFDYGTDSHALFEGYLRGEEDPETWDPYQKAAIPYLDTLKEMGVTHLEVEMRYPVEGVDVDLYGIADVWTSKGVVDHKTTSDPRWALKEHEAKEDVQVHSYIRKWMEEEGKDQGEVVFNYVQKPPHPFTNQSPKAPANWQVRAVVTKEDNDRVFEEKIVPAIKDMKKYRNTYDHTKVPSNTAACLDFGGCPYYKHCHKLDVRQKSRVVRTPKSREEVMAGFNRSKLKAKLSQVKNAPEPETDAEDVFSEEEEEEVETPAPTKSFRRPKKKLADVAMDENEEDVEVYEDEDEDEADGYVLIRQMLAQDSNQARVTQLGLYEDALSAMKYLYNQSQDLSEILQALNGTSVQKAFVQWRAGKVSPPDKRDDHDPHAYVDRDGEEVTFWESVGATKTITRAMDELGATTPQEAAALTSEQVLSMHGVGEARLDELIEILAGEGLYLSDLDPNGGLAEDPTDQDKPQTKFGKKPKITPERETQEEAVKRTTGFSIGSAPRAQKEGEPEIEEKIDPRQATNKAGRLEEKPKNWGDVESEGGLEDVFVFVDCAPDTGRTISLEQFLGSQINDVEAAIEMPYWAPDYNEGERLVVQAFDEDPQTPYHEGITIDRGGALGRLFLQYVRRNRPNWVIVSPRR